MGHTWRELDPAGAEAHNKRIERLLNLQKKIGDSPLSEFTVNEFGSIMRIMGWQHNSAGQVEPYESDFVRLESKVIK